MAKNLEWHFPELQHADSEGMNDPLLQYFGGDHNWYIAREVIQNSVDARVDADKPVMVRFEKLTLAKKDVPGLPELKGHLQVCLKQAKQEQNARAESFYSDAVEAASEDKIVVLRASDFNTTGLTGADGEKKGRWHKLVKAVGENQYDGVGGGSYGIGKGAPFVASRMHAVYYSTLNADGEVIFQGKSRLLSHEFDGVEYRGVGSFGVRGYGSVRDSKLIPAAFLRKEQGTDISILAYGESLVWMDELAKSVLENFWMSIHSGMLEVVLAQGLKEIAINRATLKSLLEKHCKDGALMYYKTVVDPTRFREKPLPVLGTCQLYVRIEEKFPRKLLYMRSPRMAVNDWRFPKSLQEPYAAVFICDNPEGNAMLRSLEPPEHDAWEPARAPNGKEMLDEIRDWVKSELVALAEEESGDPEEIPELEKFLPYDEDYEKMSEASKGNALPSEGVSLDESALEIGAEREEREDAIEEFVSKPFSKKEVGSTGQNQRKHKGGSGGGKEGTGTGNEEGHEGLARVNTSSVRFRIFYVGRGKQGSEYCAILEPLSDQEGAINVVALGDDSAVYQVPVAYAKDWDGKQKEYEHKGSLVEGLKLKKGKPVRIRIGTKSPSRYALGIENHES